MTPPQVTDVTGLLTTEQTCLEANSTNLKTAREGLVTAIKSGVSGDIATAISNLSAVQVAQETCRATKAAAIYADLTQPGQQAKVGSGLGPLMGGGSPRFGPPPGH